MTTQSNDVRTGWTSILSRVALTALLVEGATGLLITFGPFHPAVEWSVLVRSSIDTSSVGK